MFLNKCSTCVFTCFATDFSTIAWVPEMSFRTVHLRLSNLLQSKSGGTAVAAEIRGQNCVVGAPSKPYTSRHYGGRSTSGIQRAIGFQRHRSSGGARALPAWPRFFVSGSGPVSIAHTYS
jgi:hypothetical protein